MNTQCPECHTIFNASQEQLDAAGGKVRCGQCNHVFNALEHLQEELTETTEIDEVTSSQQDLEFDTSVTEPESISGEQETGTDFETDIPAESIEEESPVYPLDDEFKDEQIPSHVLEPGDFIDISEQEKSELDELPEILRANIQEENVAKRFFINTLWGIGSIILIGTLALQYAYYQRAELAANPDLRPWIMRLCEPLKCSVPMKKDLSAIQLLSRDLLIHPRDKNILLINATMVSTSEFPQPYPMIEIKLSNSRNEVVAMRRFKPEEYLPGSVNIKSGMPPQTPVNFKLETIRPKKEASTFQFDFY
jgi:predicted Zn finger-like uncharacterized protein